MKKLKIKNKSYEKLEKGYGEWLGLLGYSAQTVYMFPVHARELFHWLEEKAINKINLVTAENLKAFMTYFATRPNHRLGGGLSNAYINKQRLSLKLLVKYLNITNQAALKIEVSYAKKEESRERKILSQEDIKKLYASCGRDPLGQRDRAMLSVYYGCGLRRGEGLELELKDVLFERQLLHVRKAKNGWARYVPMALQVRQDLESYIYGGRKLLESTESSDKLFITERGKELGGVMMLKRLKYLLKSCGLSNEIGLHSLRHSIATHLLEGGMELEQIADFLGHRHLDSSQVYTHLNPKSWKPN